MPHSSHASLRSPRLLAGALVVALVALSLQVFVPRLTPRAEAYAGTLLCVGFSSCAADGRSDSGYHQHWGTMYWLMYSGRNCVNYAAYRMVEAGMPNQRPWNGSGNAMNWGVAMSSITDSTPRQGAIAWWKANAPGAGSLGHVAYVERVISPTDILISESNWGSDFDWREVTTSSGWPSGFIHFVDKTIQNRNAPSVTGTPTVGQRLVASGGRWSPSATLTYQWSVGGVVNPTTSRFFTPAAAAYGKPISVRITAAAKGYTSAVRVLKVGTTAAGTITPLDHPSILGDAIVGQKLQLTGDQFSPQVTGSKKIQWYADGVPVGGVTGRTYTPGYNVVGKAITVSVTASHAGYHDLTLTSAPTAAVLEPMVSQLRPAALTGDATRMGTLTIDPGTFSPGDATQTYQWMRDDQPIAGATRPTYRPSRDDVGHVLTVRVDASADQHRDLVTTYRVPSRITTLSTLKVSHTSTPGSVRVAVTVGALGVARDSVVGTLTVKVGKQVHQVQLVHGYAVFKFNNVAGGRRRLVVTYTGSGYVLGSSSSSVIWVKPHARPAAKK